MTPVGLLAMLSLLVLSKSLMCLIFIFCSNHKMTFLTLFLNSWRYATVEYDIWKYIKIWWLFIFISMKDEGNRVSSYFCDIASTQKVIKWKHNIAEIVFFKKKERGYHMFLSEGHYGQCVIRISAHFCPIHWDLHWLLDIHYAWVCLCELGPSCVPL